MGENKSGDEITLVIDDFAKKIESVKNQPAKVEDAFRAAATATSAAEGFAVLGPLGIPIGGAIGAIRHDDFTGQMKAHKAEIKAKIIELLDTLRSSIEAMNAPIAFLKTAEEWAKVKNEVSAAQNDEFVNGSLTGYWQGVAAERYNDKRQLQDTALESVKTACDTMITQLTAVSNEAWKYYTDIIAKLVEFLTKFASALTKLSTGVEAPFGISDAMDLLAGMINTVTLQSINYATIINRQMSALTQIQSAMQNEKGIRNDQWPKATASEYDANSPGATWEAR